jgi:hypothetical protein
MPSAPGKAPYSMSKLRFSMKMTTTFWMSERSRSVSAPDADAALVDLVAAVGPAVGPGGVLAQRAVTISAAPRMTTSGRRETA